MKLQELIDTIKYGELTNISWDNEDRIPALISYINLGLTDLYSVFPIKEKELAIRQFSHISEYKLQSKYARSNPEPAIHKYILDTEYDPFENDIIMITGAYTEHGEEVPLNDDHSPFSWFTPSYNVLQIPNADDNETAFITYKAKHRYIDPKTNDFEQEIELPPCLEEALVNYVAFKAILSMGSSDGVQLSQVYLNRYKELCAGTLEQNLLSTNNPVTNIKPRLRGYV